MIAGWMVSLLAIGALLVIVGVSAESLAARLRAPRRLVWISVMLTMCVLPATLRHFPAPISRTAIADATVDESRAASAALPSPWPGNVPAQAAASAAPEITLAPSVALRFTNAVVFVPEAVLRRTDRPLRALLVVTSLGAVLMVLVAALRVRRARRHWSAADAETTEAVSIAAGRPVRVWLSPDIGPAAFGVRHPQVVLPTWVDTLDDEARRLLLAHEASHITARDPLLLRLALSLAVLMPWNLPLLFAYRRLHRAVEHDCDSRVLRSTRDARSYGRLLLETAERMTRAGSPPSWSRVSRWLPAPVAGIGIRRSELELRLRALVRPATSWRTRVRALGAGIALLTAVLAACSVPTPERAMAGVASRTAPTGSSLMILARDGAKGGGASALDSLAAADEFMTKVLPRTLAMRDSIIGDAARRAVPQVFSDTAQEEFVWLLLDENYQVMRSNSGRQFASLNTRSSRNGNASERVAATPTTPRENLSIGVEAYVRAFPGITKQNVSGAWSSVDVRAGTREVQVYWARYIPAPTVTAAPGDTFTFDDITARSRRSRNFDDRQRAQAAAQFDEVLKASLAPHWNAVMANPHPHPMLWVLYDHAGRELGTTPDAGIFLPNFTDRSDAGTQQRATKRRTTGADTPARMRVFDCTNFSSGFQRIRPSAKPTTCGGVNFPVFLTDRVVLVAFGILSAP